MDGPAFSAGGDAGCDGPLLLGAGCLWMVGGLAAPVMVRGLVWPVEQAQVGVRRWPVYVR